MNTNITSTTSTTNTETREPDMTRSLSSRLITLTSLTIGIVFWTLPDRWIESQLRISPDGGSGVLELLLVVIPIVAGVVLMLVSWTHRERRAATPRLLD